MENYQIASGTLKGLTGWKLKKLWPRFALESVDLLPEKQISNRLNFCWLFSNINKLRYKFPPFYPCKSCPFYLIEDRSYQILPDLQKNRGRCPPDLISIDPNLLMFYGYSCAKLNAWKGKSQNCQSLSNFSTFWKVKIWIGAGFMTI